VSMSSRSHTATIEASGTPRRPICNGPPGRGERSSDELEQPAEPEPGRTQNLTNLRRKQGADFSAARRTTRTDKDQPPTRTWRSGAY
jgi:hypothetical protein